MAQQFHFCLCFYIAYFAWLWLLFPQSSAPTFFSKAELRSDSSASQPRVVGHRQLKPWPASSVSISNNVANFPLHWHSYLGSWAANLETGSGPVESNYFDFLYGYSLHPGHIPGHASSSTKETAIWGQGGRRAVPQLSAARWSLADSTNYETMAREQSTQRVQQQVN